ncbi:MAG: response regulator [Actinomycetota bacterium]|jgi:two-component system chemotaxis response regulator CheY|nr:response regulator [Actinomycetota bacterium]
MQALVVDDSKAVRSILTRILGELGFGVAQAADGVEALAELRKMKPDLALVDWNMPHLNGLELVVAIRRQGTYDGVKLMMVTTESETHQMVRALDAGADEYVMKPFTKDVIVDKLKLLGFPVRQDA